MDAISSTWRIRRSSIKEIEMLHLLENAASIGSVLGIKAEVTWGKAGESYSTTKGDTNKVVLDAGPVLEHRGPAPDSAVDVVIGVMNHENSHHLYMSSEVSRRLPSSMMSDPQGHQFYNVLEDRFIDKALQADHPKLGEYVRRARAYHCGPPELMAQAVALLNQPALPDQQRRGLLMGILTSVLVYDQKFPSGLAVQYLPHIVKIVQIGTNLDADPARRAEQIFQAWVIYAQLVSVVPPKPQKPPKQQGATSQQGGGDQQKSDDAGKGKGEQADSSDQQDAGDGGDGDDQQGGGAGQSDQQDADDQDDANDGQADATDADQQDGDQGSGSDDDQTDDDDDDQAKGQGADDDDDDQDDDDDDQSQQGQGDDDDDQDDDDDADDQDDDDDDPTPQQLQRQAQKVLDKEPLVCLDDLKEPASDEMLRRILDAEENHAVDLRDEISKVLGSAGITGERHMMQDAREDGPQDAAVEKMATPHRDRLAHIFKMAQDMRKRQMHGLESGRIDQRRLWRAGIGNGNVFRQQVELQSPGLALALCVDGSGSTRRWWSDLLLPTACAVVQALSKSEEVWALAYSEYNDTVNVATLHRPDWGGQFRTAAVGMFGNTPSGAGLIACGAVLRQSRKKRRLVIHITDGAPSASGVLDGWTATQAAVRQLEKDGMTVATLLVGGAHSSVIDHMNAVYGSRWQPVAQMTDVPGAIERILQATLMER